MPKQKVDGMHRREEAEAILRSAEVLEWSVDPYNRPIAGLCLVTHEAFSNISFTPTEVLPDAVRLTAILDLDETVWPHIAGIVDAVAEATGVPATMEDLINAGYTRKIPQWTGNAGVMAIHDQIQRGEHADFFPFVNQAWPEAVKTLEAIRFMGHGYSFLTARTPQLFAPTLRVLAWNGIAHDNRNGLIDAKAHPIPENGRLYCAMAPPEVVGVYKGEVIAQWVRNLRSAGIGGPIVMIDDLLYPFAGMMESGELVGISLAGPLNKNRPPFTGEHRVNSWDEIAWILMRLHREAVEKDPTPYRLFDCAPDFPDKLLVVSKAEAGAGEFRLENINTWRVVTKDEWRQDKERVYTQKRKLKSEFL